MQLLKNKSHFRAPVMILMMIFLVDNLWISEFYWELSSCTHSFHFVKLRKMVPYFYYTRLTSILILGMEKFYDKNLGINSKHNLRSIKSQKYLKHELHKQNIVFAKNTKRYNIWQQVVCLEANSQMMWLRIGEREREREKEILVKEEKIFE